MPKTVARVHTHTHTHTRDLVNKKQTLNNKGITLLALIITIVILLILAVVTIKTIKENKIIEYSQDAKDKYTIAQEKEQIQLALSEWRIQKNIPTNTQTFKGTMELALKKEATIGEEDNENGPLTVTFKKTGHVYEVSSDGLIKENTSTDSGENQKLGTLERIYYVVNNQWAEEYVNNESDIPSNATITAKFYNTNIEIEFDENSGIQKGNGYKVVIDGVGDMPVILDRENERGYAWGSELAEWYFAEDEPESINNIGYYITDIKINGISSICGSALENIDLKNINTIEYYAFGNCSKLKTIKIRANSVTVEQDAFYDVASDAKIYVINDSVKQTIENTCGT